jgi:hypothetical protein
MIVELLDYRPQRNKDAIPEKPDRTRVVLHPNSESLWADVCSLNQKYGSKWTDFDALELESKILVRFILLSTQVNFAHVSISLPLHPHYASTPILISLVL